MKNIHKQLVIRRREDWVLCLSHGIKRDGDYISLDDGMSFGIFCLKAIDGGENGYIWTRLSLECVMPEDSTKRVYAYASDTKFYDSNPDFDDYLAHIEGPGARKALGRIFSPVGAGDDFCVNMQGRYIWLMFEFIASNLPPRLEVLRIQISGDHMIDYLPEIYKKNGDFTKRFLSVFDSLFMDMEREIYNLPARLNFEETDNDMLRFLAWWVCIEPADLSRSAIIERIRSASGDYESMYTVAGIARSVHRLCSRKPIIIESADVDPNGPGCIHSDIYRRLYGENPHKFFILLEEDCFSSRAASEKFIKDMRMLIPAYTEFELVLLKRCVRLDWHTYLGVNTVVSNYSTVVIDENTAINYDSTIGGNDVERV